jgi:drug/metabolite transporter (DMT)-like permease
LQTPHLAKFGESGENLAYRKEFYNLQTGLPLQTVKKPWWPAMLIILLGCIWGSSFILIKRGLHSFLPIQVAGWRLSLAAVILLPWVIRYATLNMRSKATLGKAQITRTDYLNLFLSGLFGNGIPAFLFSYAGNHIPSGLSGILNAFTPMFTLLVGIGFFKDHLSRNGLLGVIAGILGACFLFGPSVYNAIFLNTAQEIDPLSLILVLMAAVMYGYNINLIKNKLHHLPPMVKTSFPFFFMGIGYILVLIFTHVERAWDINPTQAWESFGYLFILGVMGSAVSMILFNYLINHTTALVASTNTFIIPIVAVAWGLFDKEPLTWNMFVGLLLSLVGVYLVMRREKHFPKNLDDVEELKEFTE